MVGKILKALVGIVLVVLGAYLVYRWWWALLILIKGGLGLGLILAGLIAFALIAD